MYGCVNIMGLFSNMGSNKVNELIKKIGHLDREELKICDEIINHTSLAFKNYTISKNKIFPVFFNKKENADEFKRNMNHANALCSKFKNRSSSLIKLSDDVERKMRFLNQKKDGFNNVFEDCKLINDRISNLISSTKFLTNLDLYSLIKGEGIKGMKVKGSDEISRNVKSYSDSIKMELVNLRSVLVNLFKDELKLLQRDVNLS